MPSTVRDMSQAQKGLELSGELAAWRGNGTLMGHGAHAHHPEGSSLDLSKKSLAQCPIPS